MAAKIKSGDLVKVIRNELGNRFVRIVLRTGQPGQAPEERVIVDYDINDYKGRAQKPSATLSGENVAWENTTSS